MGRIGKVEDTIGDYIKEKLKGRIENVFPLICEKSLIFKGSFNSQPFEVCIVIFGANSKIEEEISDLIYEIYGVQVKPDEDQIKEFLKSQKKDLKSLIKESSMEQLERAFSGLYNALRWVEKLKNLAL